MEKFNVSLNSLSRHRPGICVVVSSEFLVVHLHLPGARPSHLTAAQRWKRRRVHRIFSIPWALPSVRFQKLFSKILSFALKLKFRWFSPRLLQRANYPLFKSIENLYKYLKLNQHWTFSLHIIVSCWASLWIIFRFMKNDCSRKIWYFRKKVTQLINTATDTIFIGRFVKFQLPLWL